VNRAAFFDLDRTLLDCNSGRLWLQKEWRDGRVSVGGALWATWWLGRYSLGVDRGLKRVFETAVQSLRGESEADFDRRVKAWFASEVRHRVRPGALSALERHRADDDRLVLATTSSTYAGRAACASFGLDHLVCTTFEVDDEGLFTGRIRESALGAEKAKRAEEWADAHDVDLGKSTFYTDSRSDVALMEKVGRPVAVNPDRALTRLARERGWEIVDWGLSPR
jgi:HAD superfamily hydrolase (TIGR01490 family)